jgi:hypothetical protein
MSEPTPIRFEIHQLASGFDLVLVAEGVEPITLGRGYSTAADIIRLVAEALLAPLSSEDRLKACEEMSGVLQETVDAVGQLSEKVEQLRQQIGQAQPQQNPMLAMMAAMMAAMGQQGQTVSFVPQGGVPSMQPIAPPKSLRRPEGPISPLGVRTHGGMAISGGAYPRGGRFDPDAEGGEGEAG